jgi:puromycin-sensitive aminopeptidase
MCQDSSTSVITNSTTAVRAADYRLPETVVPERYDIHLKPDLSKFTFTGVESVVLEIKEECRSITLNALDLQVDSATIHPVTAKDKASLTGKCSLDKDLERLTINFEKPLAPGKYELILEFKGEINDKLRGFYRSAQTAPDGTKKWIALTQFEATDARRAFPCFDEPSFKAVFRLTLSVSTEYMAISNTPVASEKIEDGLKTVCFEETMKMSTYIVAFVVGEFEKSKAVMVDGIPMQIYAPLGKLALTDFALEIGASALSFFNHYYGIPYPGKKMDMIAVPDFAFGAMENLGAVIYRENALLVDPAKASHSELERVADVIAHELAHMWFGNLTTMKWWNGIWLNEAFATFMELVAVDNFKPNWKRWETFGVSRAAAMATDGLTATRKIEFPVVRPEEANGMFDVLTYEKGASVLRMLEQYIGEDKFKNGVNAYLGKHKFANTETHDLWNALSESSSEPVKTIMDSWIFQEGYPMVDVSLDKDGKTIKLKQKRFFYLAENADKDATVFQIPLLLTLVTDKGTINKRLLLSQVEQELIVTDGKIQTVIVNSGGHGFYRVNYSQPLLEAVKALLPASFARDLSTEHGKSDKIETSSYTLSALERFNLVNDLFAMTINGASTVKQYFDFVRLFKNEPDKNVWSAIISSLQYLDRVFSTGNIGIKDLVIEIVQPNYLCLGFDAGKNDSEQTKQLRGLLLMAMGTMGEDKAVQAEAAKRYSSYIASGKDDAHLTPDVLSAVVSILASCGDSKRYDDFAAAFKSATSPQEQERYMYALAMFKDPALLQKTLDMTLSGEVRSQNAPYLVRNLMLNPQGRQVGWDFVKNNWEQIKRLFQRLLSRALSKA